MQEIEMLDKMEILAKTVWLAAGREGREAQIAFAWLIRNRLALAAQYARQQGHRHPRYGEGSLQQVCRSVLDEDGAGACGHFGVKPPLPDEAHNCTLLTVCRVWNGIILDPTAGATRFHRHDRAPCWSQQRQPSALIGQRLYYPDVERENPGCCGKKEISKFANSL